ncbi:hypothetical protein BOX15_Mlig011991g1 [Macrostomum lignano]|uniref:DMAP1-binding domain-containing protein n=1 Tax=Macrostomum lignano TaxID=282301 RepID=A0A267EG25_9PLAT|nr:hypothetical protein BOX15_Mlig011991g1 [Macrostomum lignano]
MSMPMDIDISCLPLDVRAKLAELELELSDGDITQKGYKKKRARLLDPYIAKKQQQGPAASASGEGGSGASAASPAVRDQAGGGGRRDDIRYHSEIRAEAVQAALARNREASAAGPAGVTTGAPPAAPPAPSGRRVQQSSGTAAAVRLASDGDSTDDALDDDDDDDGEEDDDVDISEEAENNAGNGGAAFTLDAGSSSADGSLPSAQQQQQQPPQQSSPARTQQQQQQQSSTGAYVIRGNAYLGMPTNDSRHIGMDSGGGGSGGNASMSTLRRVDDAVGQQRSKKQQQQQQQTSTPGPPPQSRTSAKIQQLMQTLAHPKRRPLPEMYADDEDDDLLPTNADGADRRQSAKSTDASAPKPQGEESLPVVGEPAALPPPSHASIEEALARAASSKSTAVSTMEPGGRLSSGLTYAKLYSRSRKLAHHLLNRLGHRGDLSLKPGDRVALAYPGHDPSGFAVGFLACQLAGLVAVPVEPPPLCVSATGFLLSSLEVRVLLTNDSFFRAVTKGGHEPPTYPGWPPGLLWSTAGGGDSSSNLATPPKDWQAPALAPGGIDPANLACIEYAYGRDGSVRGVCITRAALLAHTAALCSTLGYSNGETMLCLLDAKRELGLWHGLLAAICSGVHTIHVPYNVMKAEPLSWLRLLSKLRASLALAKSRDLYWSLLAAGRDSQHHHKSSHSDINLASLRCLIVSDGANPWSLTSCDSFVAAFKSRGLRSEVMCPCAYSSESLTVSVRRPASNASSDSGGATGRGVLSMLGLSHGVVRVDSEASYTSLTLQDCGQVMPNSAVAVAKLDSPRLCRQDEVGEICVCARYTGQRYWGLAGLSNQVFRCQLTTEACEAVSDEDAFVRTGLLGFLGPPGSGGLVFVCGSTEGLIVVSGRRHNSDDLIATVLAVEPLKFVHRGRIAVFSQELLRDERVIVVAEQRPDATEEQSFQWMSHVLQAVDSIHQVGVYCIALAPPNSLPRSPQGGVCPRETRRRYLANQLHPCSVLLCPHSTVTNLPRPRELPNPAHGPMSALLGSLVQGGRPAFAEGRPVPPSASPDDAAAAASLAEALRWRVAASASADNGGGHHQQHQQQQRRLLSCLNGRLQETAGAAPAALMKRAEKLANALRSRVHRDAVVAIALPPGLDLAAAVFACQLAACVPLPVRPPAAASGLNTCRLIVESGRAALLLTTQPVAKLMRSKDAMALGCSWPPIVDVDDARRRHSSSAPPPPPPSTESGAAANNSVNGSANDVAESTAYLDYSVSTTGLLTGVRFTQRAAVALCRSLKLQCELYPAREVALCLDPYSGLGFVLWCLSGVFAGHQTVLLPPAELEANPAAFLLLLSQRQIRDAFCSYTVLEHCTRELAGCVDALKQKQQINLSNLRSLVVVSEERPRLSLLTSFGRLFSPLGLKPSVVSASFGCRVNPCVCLQGASAPEPATLYADSRALRADRISLVERGSPRSLPLMECGELLAGTQVIVANPDSRTQCADSHLGELWVRAAHNAAGYWSVVGSGGASGGDLDACSGQFDATLVGDAAGSETTYARTGFLGFVRRMDITGGDGAKHDAVFIVGALDEALQLRGFRYHPVDIEATVARCHHCVGECAVFTWRSLLVVVAELQGREFEALDLIPAITSSVLREHHLIAGVVVVCDPGAIPMNSRGEKQRMHLRDGFLDDKLDPIYVAYNL